MTKFKELKVGDKLSETQYYSVVKIKDDKVQLENDNKESIVVDSNYVENCLTSANQFTKTVNVTKTEAAEMVVKFPGVVMTIDFNKQVKESDVTKEILEAYQNSTPKEFEAKMKKAVKTGLTGEPRTLVGRHFGELNELGRLNAIDLQVEKDDTKTYDSRQRQVDIRSINYFIVKGTKYIVK